MIGIGSASPRGMSGLGSTWVYGRSRVPLPPANSTACMVEPSWLSVDRSVPDSAVGGAHPTFPLVCFAIVPVVAMAHRELRFFEWGELRDFDAATSSKIAISRATCTSNVCNWPSRNACADIARRRLIVGHVVERGDQLFLRVGGRQDVAVDSVGQELAGPILRGRDHGEAAGESFQNDQRARVVIGGLHEEVARPVAGLDVGVKAQEMDRVFQSEPARQAAKRAGLATAADQQVNWAGRSDFGSGGRPGPPSAASGP